MDVQFITMFVAVPSIIGATFSTVASVIRRRAGPWALLALTVVGIGVVVMLIKSLAFPDRLFAIPAIPAMLSAAAVLEWRGRRARGALWRDVLWGTAVFTLGALTTIVVAALTANVHWVVG